MPDPTLLWMGCGGCSGETQALLGVEGQASDLLDLIDADGLRLLWHPSLAEQDLRPIHQALLDRREHLTVLCVEGSIALAEDGMFDMADGAGKFRIVQSLCEQADYVLAMGACAGTSRAFRAAVSSRSHRPWVGSSAEAPSSRPKCRGSLR